MLVVFLPVFVTDIKLLYDFIRNSFTKVLILISRKSLLIFLSRVKICLFLPFSKVVYHVEYLLSKINLVPFELEKQFVTMKIL